jgi:hypothetical protein
MKIAIAGGTACSTIPRHPQDSTARLATVRLSAFVSQRRDLVTVVVKNGSQSH